MARAPKHSNRSASHLPWDKERALPIPSGAPKAPRAGAAASEAPSPSAERHQPPDREEYPGPQTASTGEHVEPGRVGPGRRRTH